MTEEEKVRVLRDALKPFADASDSPHIPLWATAVPTMAIQHVEDKGARWVTIDHWKNASVVMKATAE